MQTALEQQQHEGALAALADERSERSTAEFPQRSRQRLELVRMLLEHGANPNAPQGGGWTPMSYAAAVQPTPPEALPVWQQIRDLLLNHGGDRDASVPPHHGKPARQVTELLAPPEAHSS